MNAIEELIDKQVAEEKFNMDREAKEIKIICNHFPEFIPYVEIVFNKKMNFQAGVEEDLIAENNACKWAILWNLIEPQISPEFKIKLDTIHGTEFLLSNLLDDMILNFRLVNTKYLKEFKPSAKYGRRSTQSMKQIMEYAEFNLQNKVNNFRRLILNLNSVVDKNE
jgi:hypothetical protein